MAPCPYCGTGLAETELFCPQCKNNIPYCIASVSSHHTANPPAFFRFTNFHRGGIWSRTTSRRVHIASFPPCCLGSPGKLSFPLHVGLFLIFSSGATCHPSPISSRLLESERSCPMCSEQLEASALSAVVNHVIVDSILSEDNVE